ncbi:MAG TPA: TolC family protein [Bryobacteraceae bacterium]|nr:TolC family protein [Bryobacteraceae bacterium]
MSHFRRVSIVACAATLCLGQTPEVSITNPQPVRIVGPLLKPFHLERRIVSPAVLENTPRLESLVRGGNLYLSVQDVIALALENNVDIAIQRYGPYLIQEVLRRTQGGGALRNVSQPIAPGPTSVSLAGVTAGNIGLPNGGSGVSSGGGLVIQTGEVPPNLDPFLFASANYQHNTSPLSNTFLAGVPFQLTDSHSYQIGYGQSFATGTGAQLFYGSSHNRVNSPFFDLNPYTSGFLDLTITQNLMQGFGSAVNKRYIKVAKNNMKVTDLQLKLQVITTVSAVMNLYWDLVSFNEDVRIKEQALDTAQKLLEGNQHQADLGTLPKIEVTRAAAEVSANKENLLIAQTNVAQQETVLKNALSRNGVASPWLDEVHIIPLDKIVVPEKDETKPASELIALAIEQRPELEQARINVESNKLNLLGTKNALLPSLQGFVELTNNGLTGSPNTLPGANPKTDPLVVGGYTNLVGQIFRRTFPSYAAGFSLNIPFRNRAAQGDYVLDQLSLRQGELQLQKAVSQVRVDVKNAIIALQQARARYETAKATRVLAQQTLDAESNRFKFGESTIPVVVQAQRDLATSQDAEVQSMANYTHAKIGFDQAVGQTLAANDISLEEAVAGHVARQSSIPAQVPGRKQ